MRLAHCSIFIRKRLRKIPARNGENEEYIQAAFGVNNDWYNGLTDSNNLVAPLDGEQTRNYYTLNVFDLAGYYHDRYLDTGDEKFLKWAKDHFAFGWMGADARQYARIPLPDQGDLLEEQNMGIL